MGLNKETDPYSMLFDCHTCLFHADEKLFVKNSIGNIVLDI